MLADQEAGSEALSYGPVQILGHVVDMSLVLHEGVVHREGRVFVVDRAPVFRVVNAGDATVVMLDFKGKDAELRYRYDVRFREGRLLMLSLRDQEPVMDLRLEAGLFELMLQIAGGLPLAIGPRILPDLAGPGAGVLPPYGTEVVLYVLDVRPVHEDEGKEGGNDKPPKAPPELAEEQAPYQVIHREDEEDRKYHDVELGGELVPKQAEARQRAEQRLPAFVPRVTEETVRVGECSAAKTEQVQIKIVERTGLEVRALRVVAHGIDLLFVHL